MTGKADSAKKKAKAEREARLAEALRANLKRRKTATSVDGKPSSATVAKSAEDQGDNKA